MTTADPMRERLQHELLDILKLTLERQDLDLPLAQTWSMLSSRTLR